MKQDETRPNEVELTEEELEAIVAGGPGGGGGDGPGPNRLGAHLL